MIIPIDAYLPSPATQISDGGTEPRARAAAKKSDAAPPAWKVQVYPSLISGGHYAHLFDPTGVCRSWRDCFSKRGALLSLLDFADERLAATEREEAMRVIREAIETPLTQQQQGTHAHAGGMQ